MKTRMPRRWESLTEEQVFAAAQAATPEEYSNRGFANGPFKPAYEESLIGKKFEFIFDEGIACTYEFNALHELIWTQDGVSKKEYYMGHASSKEGVYFVQHMIENSRPVQSRTLIFDVEENLVTLIHAQIGNGIEPREVAREFYFGYIKTDAPAPTARHAFTRDLIGKAITWTYSYDDFYVKHIYSSEYFYTYAMLKGDGCWMASNPADFVKIKDGLYIFSFLEERQVGTQAVFLMDLDKMHDVASFFSINTDRQLECYTAGAVGVWDTPHTCFETTTPAGMR
ncbi:MAG: MoaF N-terminal domain-containing protein [Clostridia bacterium]|nr:MoaF N-terminal domain-containing protein [Clostridia bacterium]